MKKILFLIILTGIVAGFCFAAGEIEKGVNIVPEEESSNEKKLVFTVDAMSSMVDVWFDNLAGNYILCKKGNRIYNFNNGGNEELSDSEYETAMTLFNNAVSSSPIQYKCLEENYSEYIQNVSGRSFSLSLTENQMNALSNNTNSSLYSTIRSYYEWEPMEFLVFSRNTAIQEAFYLSIEFKCGFFPDEFEYISKLNNNVNNNYTTNALTLMVLAFPEESDSDKAQFLQIIQDNSDFFRDNIDFSFLENASIEQTNSINVEQMVKDLKEGFYYYFGHSIENDKPIMHSSNKNWDMLYNQETRSPYALAYMLFSFYKNKPILSGLLIDGKNKLDWKHAAAIDQVQTEKFLQAVRKYYNWCFEYTPSPIYDIGDTDISNKMYDVFRNTGSKITENNGSFIFEIDSDYKKWLTDSYENDSPYRENNYLSMVYDNDNLDEQEASGEENGGTIPELTKNNVSIFGNVYETMSIQNFFNDNLYDSNNYLSPYDGYIGNPIAFQPYGVDSPRTFNRKMYEQWLDYGRRLALVKEVTTLPNGFGNTWNQYNSTGSSTVTIDGEEELEVFPFRPGRTFNTYSGIKTSTEIGNYAGVDSLGMVLGAASISGLKLYNTGTSTEDYSEKINRYFSFIDGTPEFDRADYDDMRISLSDLENQTILVPDISLIREGDLVINTNNLFDPHIGVVVKVMAINPDREDIMVLSLRRGFQMMTLGKWANSNTVFNSFTLEPDNYQVRRLLQYDESYVNTVIDVEEWELVKDPGLELSAELVFQNESMPNWIPNTQVAENVYEPVIFDSIKILGKKGTAKQALPIGTKIGVLAPLDMYWDDPNAAAITDAGNNIYRNKGYGIEFIALNTKLDEPMKSAMVIGRFLRNTNPASATDVYQLDSNITDSDCYYADGNLKEDYELYSRGKNLVFKYLDKADDKIKTTTTFGIRVVDGGDIKKIRPGDDFKLRFAAKDSTVSGIAEVDDGDFIAVYDKKMLWRANLYIDEGATMDWNNLNPWDNPDENEWHITTEEDADVDGGQIDILPWTRFSDNDVVKGAVAYEWGGQDTVISFNDKLDHQKDALNAYYSQNDAPAQAPNNDPDSVEWEDWEHSYAPPNEANSLWSNYLHGINENLDVWAGVYDPIVVDNQNYYPYIPGFNTDKYENSTGDSKFVKYGAGVDCRGFVFRVADWEGNFDRLDDIKPANGVDDWDDEYYPNPDNSAIYPPVRMIHGDELTIEEYCEQKTWSIGEYDSEIVRIVPGDIYVRTGSHITLVYKIVYSDDFRTIDKDKSLLIEATVGTDNQWAVTNNRSFSGLSNYVFRRLKTE